MGRERTFYAKPVKNFANYLRKLFLQKEKKLRKKKSRYRSYFYTSIVPANSKLNTRFMEHHRTILRGVLDILTQLTLKAQPQHTKTLCFPRGKSR